MTKGKTDETQTPEDSDVFVTPEEAAKQDEANEPKRASVVKTADNKLKQFFAGYWAKKKWAIPVTIFGLLLVLLAVPLTRYWILGTFIKGEATILVVDNKTGDPVSSAAVELNGQGFKTDGNGRAQGQVNLGRGTLHVSKQYYETAEQTVIVTLSKADNTFKVPLTATGRQVPITVTNKITGKPLAGAVLVAGKTEVKTDKNGNALMVLPSGEPKQTAELSAPGYNTRQVSVAVTNKAVAANSFTLVPSGKLYFLSNQSGKIDVVKTNLDGSDRQVVLAGTGRENPNETSLLASRDWKYLALLTRRAGAFASVHVINTANDKLTTVESGNAIFSLAGWSGNTFIYTANRNDYISWEPKAQQLRSYNPVTGKLITLDETTAEGSSEFDYGFTNFTAINILKNELVYAKNWYSSYQVNHLTGKNVDLISVRPDGSGKKLVKSFPIPANRQYYFVTTSPYEPYGVYVQVPKDDTTNTYYAYENGSLTAKPEVTDEVFNKPYPTYLISPSSSYTFWTDGRDGKNVLFVGDEDAGHPRQIASLSEYLQYGWYTDDYLLVSKDGSELYILPTDGKAPPQKITDYYKVPISYGSYGGGYGGF